MRFGNMRDELSLQRQSTTQDATGQPVLTWTSLGDRRASLEPLNGREYFQASGERSDVTTRIRMRHDSLTASLRPYDRLVDTGKSPQLEYDILSIIDPRERNRELIFMCRASGAQPAP